MSSNPVKLFAMASVAAALTAGMISQRIEPTLPETSAARSHPQSSFWSNLLGGGYEISMRKEGAPPAQPASTIADVGNRPQTSRASGFGNVVLNADRSGHYFAQVEIDGQRVPMLVDTGASIIALRYEDASSLGIYPSPSDFTVRISTANGEMRAARVNLREVRLDNITVPDVDAVVLPAGAADKSLLGMSFLKKLASFEISEGRLVLRP